MQYQPQVIIDMICSYLSVRDVMNMMIARIDVSDVTLEGRKTEEKEQLLRKLERCINHHNLCYERKCTHLVEMYEHAHAPDDEFCLRLIGRLGCHRKISMSNLIALSEYQEDIIHTYCEDKIHDITVIMRVTDAERMMIELNDRLSQSLPLYMNDSIPLIALCELHPMPLPSEYTRITIEQQFRYVSPIHKSSVTVDAKTVRGYTSLCANRREGIYRMTFLQGTESFRWCHLAFEDDII